MRQKLLHFFLNPFVISAIIAGIVLLFIPNLFTKYSLEQLSNNYHSNDHRIIYIDLNNNGSTERILSQLNTSNNGSYMLFDDEGHYIDQYNFTSPFLVSNYYLWSQDVDQNDFKEVYTLTVSSDSIFLEYNEPMGPNPDLFNKVYIDTLPSKYNETMHISGGLHQDVADQYNGNDVYFYIATGFSGYPRNVYKYSPKTGELLKSPHTTNPPNISHLLNLDTDEGLEILIENNAPENKLDSIYTKRSDYSTWLMALDDDLEFLFEPIEFKTKGNISYLVDDKSDAFDLTAIYKSQKTNILSSHYIKLKVNGEIIEKRELIDFPKIGRNFKSDEYFIAEDLKSGNMNVYNYDFEIERTLQFPNIRNWEALDLNGDGIKEWIGFSNDRSKISVFDKDFGNMVSTNLPQIGQGQSVYFIKKITKSKHYLIVQSGLMELVFSYHKNPYYWVRFLFYFGVYGVILLFSWVILQGQKIRLRRQQSIQKEISELQLKTIKNQVDPHFVFNAINTISEMTLMDNKLEADRFISRFSGFMRDTLKQSDKISTTLLDELEYTENFIKLQQIRYNESFNYEINVDDSISKEVIIPKHVLFCYAENAIKHGLALKKNGLLNIEVQQESDKLLLLIQDNGGGIRVSDKPKKNSTGSGLKIMEKIFKLYTELNHQKISHRLIELKDESGNNCGIKVEIEIFKKKKNRDR